MLARFQVINPICYIFVTIIVLVILGYVYYLTVGLLFVHVFAKPTLNSIIKKQTLLLSRTGSLKY